MIISRLNWYGEGGSQMEPRGRELYWYRTGRLNSGFQVGWDPFLGAVRMGVLTAH